ncbi:MAG: GNAT family N-acetyltransferase [Bacteroidota bacterium]
MEKRLVIRDYIPSDYKTIKLLIDELGYPSSEEEVKERLEKISSDKTLRTLVAEMEGKIIGFIGLCKSYAYERNGCYIRITALVVSEKYRKIGIGTELIQAAEEWAKTVNASCILLNSGVDRKEAHKFYENKGYCIKGYSFFKNIVY